MTNFENIQILKKKKYSTFDTQMKQKNQLHYEH